MKQRLDNNSYFQKGLAKKTQIQLYECVAKMQQRNMIFLILLISLFKGENAFGMRREKEHKNKKQTHHKGMCNAGIFLFLLFSYYTRSYSEKKVNVVQNVRRKISTRS